MNNCSFCGKKIWFWQNEWMLESVGKTTYNYYWHGKCTGDPVKICEKNDEDFVKHISSIIKFGHNIYKSYTTNNNNV